MTNMIATRRTVFDQSRQVLDLEPGRSGLERAAASASRLRCKSSSTERSFLTITIPVAAESRRGRHRAPATCDSQPTAMRERKVSAGTAAPENCSSPERGNGQHEDADNRRGTQGSIQRAARRSDRTVFSTTVTWNCLGRQMIAAAASNVCDNESTSLTMRRSSRRTSGVTPAVLVRVADAVAQPVHRHTRPPRETPQASLATRTR